jgi:hypothetical protein
MTSCSRLMELCIHGLNYERESLRAAYEATGNKAFDESRHFLVMSIEALERANLKEPIIVG